jgi:hypothetical protein
MQRYWLDVTDDRPRTIRELCEMTGLPLATLRRAVFDGRVEATKSGSIWLTSQHAIAVALDAKRIRPWDSVVAGGERCPSSD